MSFTINNSYTEQFDVLFYEMLRQKGSHLIQYVRHTDVEGEVKTLRQFDTGEAFSGEFGASGITEYSPVLYDNRRVEPVPIFKTISLNRAEMVRQGHPPVEQLAEACSSGCGVALDKLILKGIGGSVVTKSAGTIALPLSQRICVDTTQYGNKGTTLEGQGLTTAKVAYAVATLRAAFNSPQLVCVASNRAMGQLMADERSASALFNRTQAQANGYMTPFAGVDFFVTSEHVPTVTGHKATGGELITADSNTANASDKKVELAYIYALNQVVLACSKPFELKTSEDPHRNFDLVFQCMGMYDAIRMEEKSVVAIEVNTSGAAI